MMIWWPRSLTKVKQGLPISQLNQKGLCPGSDAVQHSLGDTQPPLGSSIPASKFVLQSRSYIVSMKPFKEIAIAY